MTNYPPPVWLVGVSAQTGFIKPWTFQVSLCHLGSETNTE